MYPENSWPGRPGLPGRSGLVRPRHAQARGRRPGGVHASIRSSRTTSFRSGGKWRQSGGGEGASFQHDRRRPGGGEAADRAAAAGDALDAMVQTMLIGLADICEVSALAVSRDA
jgi:hypothetical protein